MINVSNIRKEDSNGWIYLKCDINVSGMKNPFEERTMWLAVEPDMGGYLDASVYDPFVLVPLILGMFYHQDVHIDGNISPKLYHNIKHYLMRIFDNFSDETAPVNFTVKGFDTINGELGSMIGTGISCGVDSLTTIYDNFIMEDDPNYKINNLFFVNTGTHGDYGEKSLNRWKERAALNRGAAEELGLPMHLINTNYHAFTHKIDEEKIGYLAIWSCFIALQKCIKRYYASANISYEEICEFYKLSRDFDLSEYCESYMPHLLSTERFELVVDGCQYTRAEKTERISDWEFAQKHLNVCVTPLEHAKNCSGCNKCMWTLIPLEAMGKLDNFSQVFDIEKYKRISFKWKCKFVAHYGKDSMETSIVRYARKKHLRMPSMIVAKSRAALGNAKAKIVDKK